jgi:hypothetical protein
MCRESQCFIAYFSRSDSGRGATNRPASAGKCTYAVTQYVRIPMQHSNIVDIDRQFISNQLRECCDMPLPMWGTAS